MTRILTISILFILNTTAFGQGNKKSTHQKKEDFVQQIENVKYFLKQYDTLSPFSENDNHSMLIDSIGHEITTRLLNVLNDKRILNYQIESILKENELSISKSNDNRIYFFSIDQKTGGTYRSRTNIIHYRLPNGTVKADFFGEEYFDGIGTPTFTQVFLIDSLTQKYFAIGGVQTCNTCFSSFAITLQLDTNSINTELIDKYEGRNDDLITFEYNDKSKELDYEFYSADNNDLLYGGKNEISDLKHRHKRKFKYLNGRFVQIENCEYLDKK